MATYNKRSYKPITTEEEKETIILKLGDTVHILKFTHKRLPRIKTGEICRVKQITKTYKFNPPSITMKYLLDNGKEYDIEDLEFNKELSRDNRLKDLLK